MGKKPSKKQAAPAGDPAGDPRVAAIVTVGWVSLAMLGISIPLTRLLMPILSWGAAALPILIVLGAGSMAARIWFDDDVKEGGETKEELRARIADLEKRLSDLETIDSLEAHFSERHRRKAAAEEGRTETTTGPAEEDQVSA